MTFPNHLAAGITFTGIFAAIADVNIFADPSLIGLTIFAAVLPDIDHTASPVGKIVYPFARWLHRRVGHRTLTHSLLALLTLSFLVGILETWFGQSNSYRIVFFFAYFSHIVGDMITIQGVQFFYPFSKAPCVIPGRRELRFRTGDRAHETVLFAGIALTFLFCQPLMKNGFWTTYNRSFGYPKHLWSEFKKSEDILEVDFAFRDGSEIYEGKAYCLEATEDKFTLLENGKFRLLDASKQVILHTIPTHTGKRFSFQQQTFVNITSDSLNRLISDKKLMDIEVKSDQNFLTHIGQLKQEGKSYTGKYIDQAIIFGQIPSTVTKDSLFLTQNPHIKSLREKLNELLDKQNRNKAQVQSAKNNLQIIQSQASNTEDLYRREALIKDIEKVEKEIANLEKLRTTRATKITDTRRQIRELKERDQQSHAKSRLQAEVKKKGEIVSSSDFTGIVEFVVIEE